MQVGTYEDVMPFGSGIDTFPVVQVLRKCDEAVCCLGAVLPHVSLALILQSRHKGSSTMHHTCTLRSRCSRLSRPFPVQENQGNCFKFVTQ